MEDASVNDLDVLIVGAGPVGLAVAVELGLRGIRARIVERQPEIKETWTRAMNMNMRTMEHVRRWGLAEKVKDINFVPKDWPANFTYVDGLGGEPLATTRAEGMGWHRVLDYATEDALWVAQGQVQHCLMEKAEALGVAITFGAKVESLEIKGPHRVDVGLRDEVTGAQSHVSARYVIGCDGSRSIVREASGIESDGLGTLSRQMTFFFRAPDLLAHMRRLGVPDSIMYGSAIPEIPGLARIIRDDNWEFSYYIPAGGDENQIDPHAMLRRLLGPDVPYSLDRTYAFTYLQRIAKTLRAGPVMIAGDAAHIIPPHGGQNLNLGFGDAVNIGWKLAHVLRGWADESILDTYGPERLAIIHRTAGEVQSNYERMVGAFKQLQVLRGTDATTEEGRQTRRALAEDVADMVHANWVSEGMVLDLRYPDSPIVAAPDGEAPEYTRVEYRPFAGPGHRAPMFKTAAGVPIYDLFGQEYTLLDFADSGQAIAGAFAAAGVPLKHLHHADPAARELYGADLTLIRPDQQVVWRGDSADAGLARQLLDLAAARGRVTA